SQGGDGGAAGAAGIGVSGATDGTAGNVGSGGAGVTGSGLTIINNGLIMGGLSGDGATRADAIVFTGGINVLSGTGTVGSFTMTSNGPLPPGNGTQGSSLTVSGNLAFQSGAIYLVQINPATASFATVTGNASLAGTVQTVFASGTYSAKQYDIFRSAGLGGARFSGVNTVNLP